MFFFFEYDLEHGLSVWPFSADRSLVQGLGKVDAITVRQSYNCMPTKWKTVYDFMYWYIEIDCWNNLLFLMLKNPVKWNQILKVRKFLE